MPPPTSAWQRYFLCVAYHGKHFVGFQRQPKSYGASVERLIHQAYDNFVGASNVREAYGSSRTDTGVHAFGNTLHVELRHCRQQNTELVLPPHSSQTVMKALNFYIDSPHLTVIDCQKVSTDFHARFSCTGRSYIYRVIVPLTGNYGRSLFDSETAWVFRRPGEALDVEAMRYAAKKLEGHHDFSTFRSAGCQAHSPEKHLAELSVHARRVPSGSQSMGSLAHAFEEYRLLGSPRTDLSNFQGGSVEPGAPLDADVVPEIVPAPTEVQEILIKARAPSFLYHQVRNLVGYLVAVGQRQECAHEVEEVIRSKCRDKSPYTAPARGLALAQVEY